MQVTLTATLAYASGMDAGNANMRKAGRKRWNGEDADAAADKTVRLLLAMIEDPEVRDRIARNIYPDQEGE